jgi:hydrogenase nickel incorporation protein HypA/HybF
VHEFSLCEALLRQVEAIAAAHRAERVTMIRLRVGPLAGVEAALLERAFTLARAGGVAEAAELVIVTAPIAIACGACGATAEVAANRLCCPACGGIDVRVTAGEELILESVELDVADDGAPAAAERKADCHV